MRSQVILIDFGILAAKAPDLASIPLFKRVLSNSLPEQADAAVGWLKARAVNRPGTIKTLRNSLKTAVFGGRLEDDRLDSLMEELRVRGVFLLKGRKVSYIDA
jgi:hypothetical protein